LRTSPFKIIVYILLTYSATAASALDTAEEEKACKDIGFTKKNADFGECVLELLDRKAAIQEKVNASQNTRAIQLSYKSTPALDNSNDVWDLRKAAYLNTPITYLNRPDGTVYETLKVEDAKLVVSVANAIGNSAGIRPTLFLRESSQINAAATFDKDGRPIIIINKPMMDLIKDDPDMAAALIGHEMAHLYLKHPGATAGTNAAGALLGAIAGIALEVVGQRKLGVTNLGIQGGSLIGTAFSTSFTRDQEREADRLAVTWAKQSGYDPNGAVRLFQALEKKSGNSLIPFFQTHPNPSERIENAQKAINGGR
jgi:Zn-dependent protease with chaperone function